jgi:multidrug efflux pump subunit AcrB
LIDGINTMRLEGMSPLDSVLETCQRRFRPILLTSATTFLGLAPMLTETSTQARFLIPMVISLAFGLLFATVLTLVVVPAGYLVLEDGVRIATRAWSAVFDEPAEPAPPKAPAE